MPYESQFGALAHDLRQKILTELHFAPQSVRSLTDALGVSQPVTSQHLKVLRDAGLVSAVEEGAKRIYRIERAGLENLRDFLDQHWDAS